MSTLIISCTTGEGHNSCAKAIKEVYDNNNEKCEIVDGLGFISQGLSYLTAKGHILLYRHFPKIFNLGYRLSEDNPSIFSPGSLIYKIFSKGTLKLKNHIIDGSFERVICTHPFAAVILTEMQNRYSLPIKTAFVATDYTCCPSVKDSNLDYYFIPDKILCKDFLCKHITEDKLFPIGIPIRQDFYSHKDSKLAKAEMGISPENKHIVMMCGSMGCGPLAKLATTVAKKMQDNCELTVICGTNTALKRTLDKKTAKFKNVHILGFVNNMPTVLDSADLYLTKPGGISTTEAVAKLTPMLFVNTVAACETYNLHHFVNYKVAYSGKTTKELCSKCLGMINDGKTLTNIRQTYEHIEKNNTSELIRKIIK